MCQWNLQLGDELDDATIEDLNLSPSLSRLLNLNMGTCRVSSQAAQGKKIEETHWKQKFRFPYVTLY